MKKQLPGNEAIVDSLRPGVYRVGDRLAVVDRRGFARWLRPGARIRDAAVLEEVREAQKPREESRIIRPDGVRLIQVAR